MEVAEWRSKLLDNNITIEQAEDMTGDSLAKYMKAREPREIIDATVAGRFVAFADKPGRAYDTAKVSGEYSDDVKRISADYSALITQELLDKILR